MKTFWIRSAQLLLFGLAAFLPFWSVLRYSPDYGQIVWLLVTSSVKNPTLPWNWLFISLCFWFGMTFTRIDGYESTKWSFIARSIVSLIFGILLATAIMMPVVLRFGTAMPDMPSLYIISGVLISIVALGWFEIRAVKRATAKTTDD